LGLRLMLRRGGDTAQVANYHPHTFRRTFTLWGLRAGMDLVPLAALMGHSDLAMLQRYLALVEHDPPCGPPATLSG
jgi:integrase